MLEHLHKQLFAGVFQSTCSEKFHNIHRKTLVSESLIDKVADLKAYKKRLLHRFLPVNIAKFALFIEHFWWLLLHLFNKVAGLKTSNVIKKRLQHRYFPVKSAKVWTTPFFTEHDWWLLLNFSGPNKCRFLFKPIILEYSFKQSELL